MVKRRMRALMAKIANNMNRLNVIINWQRNAIFDTCNVYLYDN